MRIRCPECKQLIECPDCNFWICPFCGTDLNEIETLEDFKEENKQEKVTDEKIKQ